MNAVPKPSKKNRPKTKKQIKMSVSEFKAITEKEINLEKQCEDYLDLHKIPYIRIPDAIYKLIFGFNSKAPVHLKVLISKFIKGLPDLTILSKHGKFNSTLCIELKTKKGKLSQGQVNFGKLVNVHVVRSFEEFEQLLNEFLNIGRNDGKN